MAAMPRNVDAMSQFGSNIEGAVATSDNYPQLANRQLLNDAAPAVMNLARDEAFKRQTDGNEIDGTNSDDQSPVASNDDEIRCIPKVMQVGQIFIVSTNNYLINKVSDVHRKNLLSKIFLKFLAKQMHLEPLSVIFVRFEATC